MHLAMGEELELWDDQSWAFPNLATFQEDCAIKSAEITKDEAAPPPPPPPPPIKGKKKRSAVAAGGGDGGGESEDHELHIWTERERRKKMRNMFSNLHALLPHIPPKADKSTIVDEAVNYIKNLQQTLEELEKRKLERMHGVITQNKLTVQSREAFLAELGSSGNMAVTLAGPNQLYSGPDYPAIFKTWTSPNVILNICGRDGHINVCCMRKPGLFTAVCFVMEKHNLEVVSAQASSDRARSMYMIHARANGGSDQFQQAIFPIEETFKQAAAELMLWVNS
ncbi:hypothetical protein C2S51_002520 [Perilla frutescens var. frutescens]|nr:hypothetical protein C2S51_002520 [Perilla frutescens var. frutescens]